MINELWHSNWSFSDLSCTIVTSNDQRPRAKYLCQSILETRSNKIDKAKNQSRSQKLLSNFYGNCKFLSMAIFVQFVFVSMIWPIFTHSFFVFFLLQLEYRMPLEIIQNRLLQVTVWSHDSLQENEFLGGVELKLGELENLREEYMKWFPLGVVTRS